MTRPRVLVTGPVESISDYAEAARGAGWDPIERPLLRIETHAFDVRALSAESYDWVCLTSASALPFLESAIDARPALREAVFAVVGERTASRVRAAVVRTAPDAEQLAAAILERAPRGARVLWPRGNLSDELARVLRDGGLDVDAPIAYTTTPLVDDEPLPQAEAVFFASPSAVRALHLRAAAPSASRQVAIAIGATTFDALAQETEARFFDTISLPQPTPEAFAFVLAHLDVGTPP